MDKKGQVWVETVIYTLIGLAIIGLVLATALPKINAKKDEIVIEQSIEALGNVDDKVYEVQRAAGNRRVVDLEIGNGVLNIDTANDEIYWELDSSFAYSEPDTSVPLGRLNVTTTSGSPWDVELKLGYAVDIQWSDMSGVDTLGTKQLNPAPTPYKLIIENSGKNADGNIIITFSEA